MSSIDHTPKLSKAPKTSTPTNKLCRIKTRYFPGLYPTKEHCRSTKFLGVFGALWGITGFALLLGSAIFRLSSPAQAAFLHPFRWYHWVGLLLTILFMVYLEGYRGFQKGHSPRMAARAKYLAHHPQLFHVLLAPFFCLGYFYTSSRRQISAITLTLGIIMLVLLVRLLDQPWRGIIDVGVVLGLSWGLVSLLLFCVQVFTSATFDHSPEVPYED